MKKLLLSFGVAFMFGLYSLTTGKSSNILSPINADSLNSPISQSPVIPTPSVSSKYKDGQYTGNTVDAFYGNVQVQATIKNGKITQVQFLQYPNDRRNSIEINSQAMPFLQSEAIRAQSANVNIVSGATDTSQAFIESLSSALVQAQYKSMSKKFPLIVISNRVYKVRNKVPE